MSPISPSQLASVREDLERGWSVPTEWYSRPDVFELEKAAIFSKKWHLLKPASFLRNPGDCVVGEIAGTPVVVTRDQDNVVRGFVNVCRHRGYVPVDKDKNCKTIVCPYHAWTYNLDGTLRGAKGSGEEPGFDRTELGLKPISAEVWGLSIWVNLDANAAPFLSQHANIAQISEDAGMNFDPDAYVFHSKHVFRFKANWKLWYDNGAECYHCPLIHGDSFNEAFDTTPENSFEEEFGSYTVTHFKPTEIADSNTLRSQKYNGMQIYPGAMLIQQDDMMFINCTIPIDSETTEFEMYTFSEPGVDPARVEDWYELWRNVYQEDADAVEVQQKALASGQIPRSRYMVTQERRMVFFNRLILADLAEHMDQIATAAE